MPTRASTAILVGENQGHHLSAPQGSCASQNWARSWEYPVDAENTITDCYALNVSGSGAAICFYTDFPICRISSGFELQYWKTNLLGCRELAISETGPFYPINTTTLRTALILEILTRDGSQPGIGPSRIAVRFRISEGQLLGRGRHLYFFDTSSAYRASLE